MHSISRIEGLLVAAGVFLTTLFSALPAGGADAPASAKALPPDSFLLVEVENVNALREKLKQTGFYGLYKEPAMQPFVAPAEKKIRELIDEKLKKAWKEAGLEDPPDELPIPEGRVVLGVRMGVKTVTMPNFEYVDGELKITGQRELKQPAPQVIIQAEMGAKLEAAKDLVNRLTEKSVDKGWKRETQSVRGVDIQILLPPAPPQPEGAARPTQPKGEPACYAFKGSTLLFASDVQLLKDVLARLGGAELQALGDNAHMKGSFKAIGGTGDVNVYLDIKSLMDFVKSMAPAEQAEKTAQIITALGGDCVSGLALSLSLAPAAKEEVRVKALLGTMGQPVGIPALLAPISMSTKPSPLLTKGLASFFVANYDLAKVYDQIMAMVLAASGQNLDMTVEAMMAMTGGQGENPRPPVDLRKDVLGQLAPPLIVLGRIEKPYSDPNASKTMLAVGVRDGGILDAAIGRIHEAFLAQGFEKLRRELLNRTIYLLPPGMSIGGPMMGPGLGGPAARATQLALSVAGNHFVFGSVAGVEQAIRNLKRTGVEPITADPTYQYASRYLPAQAGIVIYENNQISAEMVWTQLKAAASKANEQDDANVTGPSAAPTSPMGILVNLLKDYCDFNTLPEFQTVKKYFGASVGFVVSRDEGIYAEMIGLKAP